MEPTFIGEHLRPGQLGHFFAITSFVAALFSLFSYMQAARAEGKQADSRRAWQLLGRNSFIIHAATVVGIFLTLYYIITNHMFEYHYVWEHSSTTLPMKYLLSCFWEGQEGSFLLWSFWHCMLGLVVMATARGLETRVMAIIALVQVCLATMQLGIFLTPDIKIGSNAFMLLRHSMQGAPIFSQPNYLESITDGNGLNVLLQNYWMVIHPPVLFLGFAATLIPFAYCMAALWKGEYETFVKPTLLWSLFGGAVLGLGIMMGGKWAYESLNFGGYWAWDPVENASLVPWLILVAGLHTLLIFKATKRSLSVTFILLLLSHLFVWYSTFLTRTGVLGDTSVHAFTGEGKSLYWHLLIIIGILVLFSKVILLARWKSLPRVKGEEAAATREFWMFIGSIVLLLSSIQIIFATSLPIWAPLAKWITGKDFAPPVDPVTQYNNIQVWVAIVISLLSATVLYLRFKQTDMKKVWKRLGITAAIALAVALFIGFTQKIDAWQYALLLFAATYGLVANIYYAIAIQKGKLKKLGATVTHFGFATMLLGILLSSYNKEVISLNTLGEVFPLGKATPKENLMESRENVLLFRNVPVAMSDYKVVYRGDSTSSSDARTFYKIEYERIDTAKETISEKFTLYPTAFVNPKGQQGLIANPDSKHYLTKDVFTYITSFDRGGTEDTGGYRSHIVHQGDSVFLNKGYIVFSAFNTNVTDPRYSALPGDIAVAVKLDVYDLNGHVRTLNPVYYIRDKYEHGITDTLDAMSLYVRLAKILPDQQAAEIQVKQAAQRNDYVTLKAIVFPYINILWVGVVIMVIGFLISMWNRSGKKVVA